MDKVDFNKIDFNALKHTWSIKIKAILSPLLILNNKISVVLLSLFFILFTQISNASISKCFGQAETYYEQVYCEIKNKGKGKSLPLFIDFKKNNEITQALLIKRDASSLNIVIKMPKRNKQDVQLKSLKFKNTKNSDLSLNKRIQSDSNTPKPCSFNIKEINCIGANFYLVGNKENSELSQDALSADNKIALSTFSNEGEHPTRLNNYLYENYIRYIQKMLEIGLGGVTMSYTKFAYLFKDLLQKNVDFADRFEIMFQFLKKDKRQLAVNKQLSLPSTLTIDNCYVLTSEIYVCDNRFRNYVYLK